MQKSQPFKISIIIPAYNVAEYIQQCVESCLGQDYDNLEIIAVNDGSTDSTRERIEKLTQINSKIILINKPNGGVTSARQAGLEVATGEYIFFLDGDDRLCLHDSISRLVTKAMETDADHVAGDFIIVHKDGKRVSLSFPPFKIHNAEEALAYAFLNNDFYYTGRLLRRSLINLVNKNIPRELTYGEDTYAVVKLLSKIRKSAKVEGAILEYVQRNDSVTNRLSDHDLKMRNKATSLTLALADQLQFERFASSEIMIYAARELYQSIALGVPNNEVAQKYLKRIHKYSAEIKNKLGYKVYITLLLAKINVPVTCKTIQLLKKIK